MNLIFEILTLIFSRQRSSFEKCIELVQTLTIYYYSSSHYHLILTETLLQNNLSELWVQLNFMLPKIFNSLKSFDEWFNTPFANSSTGDKIEKRHCSLFVSYICKVLCPFLLRWLKKNVENKLPNKIEKVIKIRMSTLQMEKTLKGILSSFRFSHPCLLIDYLKTSRH